MKYFTASEAQAILREARFAALVVSDSNPNCEAAEVLRDKTMEVRKSPFFVAAYGYALGRAAGIREERARRQAVQS